MKRPMRGIFVIVAAALTLGTAGGNVQSANNKLIATTPTLVPRPYIATAPTTPVIVQTAPTPTQTAKTPQRPSDGPTGISGSLVGAILPGNNCVACVRAMTGRSQNGNAGTWRASHSTPRVGDIMIWRPGQQGAGSAGHVGVVVGIKGNKVIVRHCNWGGGQTEFYSTGLFW